MTAKILSAAPVVEKIKKELTERCNVLKSKGITPSMCVVLVGDNPASLSYIKNKKRMCEEVGAKFRLVHLPSNIFPNEFLDRIQQLNSDPSIHGIIIQLPVPDQLKSLDLSNLIDPFKDIDGFHGLNTQKLYSGTKDLTELLPCTPKGIVNLLRFYDIDLKGKNIVISGRSLIVGKPLSMLLSNFDATVTLTHSQTKNLKDYTKRADILIAAIGKANYFNRSFFNPEMKTIVVDVGINSLGGNLTGDVDLEDVKEVVGGITPVPGGVGPMTVISLIENLISATDKKIKENP